MAAAPDGRQQDIRQRIPGVALVPTLGIDPRALLESLHLVVQRAIAHPQATLATTHRFLNELTEILRGSSTLAPRPDDRRFADAAFAEHPLFRRVGQSYVAWARAVDEWLASSGLVGNERERARFVLDALKDLAAPVNTLPGNPEALRKAWQSRGESLAKGFRHFLDDLRHHRLHPGVTDRRAFELGSDVAASRGSVVFRNELFELVQYAPLSETVYATPIVCVFSQLNRFYLADLAPDQSLFQQLLRAGIRVFAISWRNPTDVHGDWGLEKYVEGVIEAIDVAREITARPRVSLMAVCAGGITAAAAAGVLHARARDAIDTLTLLVSVLDHRQDDGDFGLLVSDRFVDAEKARVRSRGTFDEKDALERIAWLRPEENVLAFYRSSYLLGEEPVANPVRFWSMDFARVPARLYADLLDLVRANGFARRELMLHGHCIDLSHIRCPVFVLAGSEDPIAPWRACYRSTQLFGGPVTFVLTRQRHAQSISDRPDGPHVSHWMSPVHPLTAEEWAEIAIEHPGWWRNRWLDWLAARSGARVAAPAELGSPAYPEVDPAPGRYVRER